MFASGTSIRDVTEFLEMVYGIYYSPSSLNRLTEIAVEKIETWRKRKLSEDYFAVYLDAMHLSVRRGEMDKEPVYVALEPIEKRKYPEVVKSWKENFNILTTFMKYPEEIKPYIYTTNMLERLMKEVKGGSR